MVEEWDSVSWGLREEGTIREMLWGGVGKLLMRIIYLDRDVGEFESW